MDAALAADAEDRHDVRVVQAGRSPRLVVVIQNRDGSQDVVSPPPEPMIEHDPLAGQMSDLEPQGPRN